MSDLVSIIVPVYNAAQTIQRCIESLINQSYSDIQVVLIDDGSTDSSLSICKRITKDDSRFLIIEKNNGGVSSARNCGLENAQGKYLMFLDSDDWFEKDTVERYVNMISDCTADVVIGSLHGILAEKNASFIKKVPVTGNYNGDIWNVICDDSEMFGYIGGKMFRKDIIDTYSIRFDERMYAQEDLDFCLSYYDVVNNFHFTDYPGYQYSYQQGKRIPPYCDFIRNQLKLLNIAQKKCEISFESYRKIQERICGYIYVMFYEAKTKRDVIKVSEKINTVKGINMYLRKCSLQGEIKYIISLYLKNKQTLIYLFFKIRGLVKKILRKE
ncbi:MAG: glycosyltransferase family 2 protein [Schaedlerella sp.]|nr:glycosyltransferase family 2 protein [Schaedlerella sp.]